MTSITAKLIKDGNSVAVRLPKTVLAMSGLHDEVQLEVEKGRVTLRQAQPKHPHAGWEEQIKKVLEQESHLKEDDFADMNAAMSDGLDSLEPWNGPTYDEWLEQNAKK